MKTSLMLESYCADIERLVREGTLRMAVRLSAALPDICAALEDAQIQSSREHYEAWCSAWLTWKGVSGAKPVSGARLYRLYVGRARIARLPGSPEDQTAAALHSVRMSRRARRERTLARPRVSQPATRIEGFQVALIEALIEACRRWYREQGAANALVQRNLGRLLVSG